MARKGQQTRQININVTEAQWAAVNAALDIAMKKRGQNTKNDALLFELERLCVAMGIDWPKYVSQREAHDGA